MPCYTDECNQAPFELFDPTLIYPERSPRGATPQSSPSRPILGQIGYPLCFDNDPFCLSYNPFLLITIWIAYVAICFYPVLASLFRSLCKERNASPIFSIVCSLFAKNNRGVPRLFPIWNSAHSFAVRGKSSPYFSTASSLFTKTAGAYPTSHFL